MENIEVKCEKPTVRERGPSQAHRRRNISRSHTRLPAGVCDAPRMDVDGRERRPSSASRVRQGAVGPSAARHRTVGGRPRPALQDRAGCTSRRRIRGVVGVSQHPTETGRKPPGPPPAYQRVKLCRGVYIVAHGKTHRRGPGRVCEVTVQGRKESRGLPRKRRERLVLKLVTRQPNQVGPGVARRGPKDRSSVVQPLRDRCPVDLVEGWTVIAHGNHAVVPRRKRVGDGVGEPRPEGRSSLLRVGDLQHRQSTLRHSLPRVLVEGLRDPPIFRVVVPHELLVQPLPLRTAAEEQNGGV